MNYLDESTPPVLSYRKIQNDHKFKVFLSNCSERDRLIIRLSYYSRIRTAFIIGMSIEQVLNMQVPVSLVEDLVKFFEGRDKKELAFLNCRDAKVERTHLIRVLRKAKNYGIPIKGSVDLVAFECQPII